MAQFDTVIKNGIIIDGTGLPRVRGDIAIKNGRIAKMGRIDATEAKQVIDAEGLIVAPGFVDLHTHYDAQVHWDPYCTISGWHGVTSVAIGNCGFGFAPARADSRERLLKMMTRTEQIPLESMVQGMGLDWVTTILGALDLSLTCVSATNSVLKALPSFQIAQRCLL